MTLPAPRPLAGCRIVVTRPRQQAAALWDRLAALGAEVLAQPAIAIGPPDDWGPLDAALQRLPDFDWIVFSSTNGVSYFLQRLAERGYAADRLQGVKRAAIGPGTAEELRRCGLAVDLVPEAYRAESLAEALVQHAPERRFLLIRASRGREVLAEQLVAAGGEVHQAVAYSSRDVARPDPQVAQLLAQGQIDWVTVTSSAIARSLVHLFGEALRRTRLASISPITSATLKELGYTPTVEAQEFDMQGLVAALVAGQGRAGDWGSGIGDRGSGIED